MAEEISRLVSERLRQRLSGPPPLFVKQILSRHGRNGLAHALNVIMVCMFYHEDVFLKISSICTISRTGSLIIGRRVKRKLALTVPLQAYMTNNSLCPTAESFL